MFREPDRVTVSPGVAAVLSTVKVKVGVITTDIQTPKLVIQKLNINFTLNNNNRST
jgi:hypothetical protein